VGAGNREPLLADGSLGGRVAGLLALIEAPSPSLCIAAVQEASQLASAQVWLALGVKGPSALPLTIDSRTGISVVRQPG